MNKLDETRKKGISTLIAISIKKYIAEDYIEELDIEQIG